VDWFLYDIVQRGKNRARKISEDREHAPAIPPNFIPVPDVLYGQQDGAGIRELCAASTNRGEENLAMARRLLDEDVQVSESTKVSLGCCRCGNTRSSGHTRTQSKG
jgi:hypothetical protein